MPEHLEAIDIGSLYIINDLYTYLRNEGNNYTAALQPSLEKCVAEKMFEKIKPLAQAVGPQLCKTPLKAWVIFRSTATARVGTSVDQYIIPLYIPEPRSYLSTDGMATKGEHVALSLGSAVFCAAGKPAFISEGVVFYLLTT